jgi:hypothetical protein
MLHVWYIYLHDWLIFRANVGKYTRKYTSTMEHMGYCITTVIAHPDFWWDTDPKIGFRTCARKGLEKDAPLLGTVSDKNVLYSENICHTIEHVATEQSTQSHLTNTIFTVGPLESNNLKIRQRWVCHNFHVKKKLATMAKKSNKLKTTNLRRYKC